MLAIGAVLASFMGTTGASMLLIRPLIRANDNRRHKAHVVVFFIFIVSNAGGSLTPLGDPPLFLGFLKGVDFFWTARHILPETLFLRRLRCWRIFYALDSWYYHRREELLPRRPDARHARASASTARATSGCWPAVVGLVLLSGIWKSPVAFDVAGIARSACRAWCATSGWSPSRCCRSGSRRPAVHAANQFSLGPDGRRWPSCSPASS